MLNYFERETEAVINRLCNAFVNTVLRMKNKGCFNEKEADELLKKIERIRAGDDIDSTI